MTTPHDERVRLAEWARKHVYERPELAQLDGVPACEDVGEELRKEGVRPGGHQFFAVPRRGYSGMYIVLKPRIGGRLGPHQREWAARHRRYGYAVRVCNGWEEARDAILEYLDGPGVREAAA